MTIDSLQPVAADQLRISVDIGEQYEATERVASALAELSTALLEAEAENVDGEVQGFLRIEPMGAGYMKIEMEQVRPFVYDSQQPDHFCSTVGNKQEPYLRVKRG